MEINILHQGIFLRQDENKTPVCLLFAQEAITILNAKKTTKYRVVPLSFDLKCTILRQSTNINNYIGFKLQLIGGQVLSFHTQDKGLMMRTKQFLSKKLNLRGFHELFKASKKIGKGNFASVYLAERLQDKKQVAVKAFSKQVLREDEKGGFQSLINQIGLLRELDHQNIMKLYQVYQSQNSIYLIMELIEKGQLFNKIQSKYRFSSTQIRIIMRGILMGLDHIHAKNIVHRDLKPQNLLLRGVDPFDIAICDFGLATNIKQPEYIYVRCGTPGYVAPEIVNIKDMKTRMQVASDLFSSGLIFHILLTGKSIFTGKNYNQILAQNRACQFKLNSSNYDQFDKNAMDLLRRMLTINPKTRITSKQALEHPFFAQKNFFEPGSTSTIDSPVVSKGSAGKSLLRDDSCVKFVMKQVGFTGDASSQRSVDSLDSPGMKMAVKSKVKPQKSRFNKMQQEKEEQEEQQGGEMYKKLIKITKP